MLTKDVAEVIGQSVGPGVCDRVVADVLVQLYYNYFLSISPPRSFSHPLPPSPNGLNT